MDFDGISAAAHWHAGSADGNCDPQVPPRGGACSWFQQAGTPRLESHISSIDTCNSMEQRDFKECYCITMTILSGPGNLSEARAGLPGGKSCLLCCAGCRAHCLGLGAALPRSALLTENEKGNSGKVVSLEEKKSFCDPFPCRAVPFHAPCFVCLLACLLACLLFGHEFLERRALLPFHAKPIFRCALLPSRDFDDVCVVESPCRVTITC
jgi:hypothetical protein